MEFRPCNSETAIKLAGKGNCTIYFGSQREKREKQQYWGKRNYMQFLNRLGKLSFTLTLLFPQSMEVATEGYFFCFMLQVVFLNLNVANWEFWELQFILLKVAKDECYRASMNECGILVQMTLLDFSEMFHIFNGIRCIFINLIYLKLPSVLCIE